MLRRALKCRHICAEFWLGKRPRLHSVQAQVYRQREWYNVKVMSWQ